MGPALFSLGKRHLPGRLLAGQVLHQVGNLAPRLLDASHDDLMGLAESVFGNTTARRWLRANGPVELSFLWVDEDTGLKCKGRADKWIPDERGLVDSPPLRTH